MSFNDKVSIGLGVALIVFTLALVVTVVVFWKLGIQ